MAAPKIEIGVVKQIMSGDVIVVRKNQVRMPAPERMLVLNGVLAPKLARQKYPNKKNDQEQVQDSALRMEVGARRVSAKSLHHLLKELGLSRNAVNTFMDRGTHYGPSTRTFEAETKDEPFAWEAREYLRKLLIGKEVAFVCEHKHQADREYAKVWAGKDPNKDANISVLLLNEGLMKMRDQARNHPQNRELVEAEERAKSRSKGIWSSNGQAHIRDVKWQVDDAKAFLAIHQNKELPGVVEYLRDGCTYRICLLPSFHYIMVMLSGVRCPMFNKQPPHEPLAEEAKYFIQREILNRDVTVSLENVNNNHFVGSVTINGTNIASIILSNGYGKCQWSNGNMKPAIADLRRAEKTAKDARLGVWCDHVSNAPEIPETDRDISGTVVEIVGGDTLVVKTNNGDIKRVSLSSIRPPRETRPIPAAAAGAAMAAAVAGASTDDTDNKGKGARRLYDIPWLFEAREFLRKKLIGKKAIITVDYIQPANDKFPDKMNCTVQCGGLYIAEAMVAKGLVSVVRHRNDDDQRSSRYDKLMEAEQKATKACVGIHSKKDQPMLRVQDVSSNPASSKKLFPFLKRLQKTEAIVEYVASGSRLKLYILKDSMLVNFILAGVTCPRADPHRDAALEFTKQACLQRDVHVSIVDIDKGGIYIGWLFVDDVNLSISLAENGHASLRYTPKTTDYGMQLKDAVQEATRKRIGIWKDDVEREVAPIEPVALPERQVNYENVEITIIKPDGQFYVQNLENSVKLIALSQALCQEYQNNPPVPGACWPTKGKICAARFSGDNRWYRARIDKVQDVLVQVYYIDYGNREELHYNFLAELPDSLKVDPPYTGEYELACVKFPPDVDDRLETVRLLSFETQHKKLLMNVESRGTPTLVTFYDPLTLLDIGKGLIADGLALVQDPRDRRLAPLVTQYRAAQEIARRGRFNIWRHGDITDDDAVEFGARSTQNR